MLLDAPYSGEVKIPEKTWDYLKKKKHHTVGLYASIQFCRHLEKIKKEFIYRKIKVINSLPSRAHLHGQILGCDNDSGSLNITAEQRKKIDSYIYLGDGRFHPLALLYQQKDLPSEEFKEVICCDPFQDEIKVLSFSEIKDTLKKYRASLLRFLNADKVGVIITIKPGQEQLKPALTLEKKYSDKKFYYFIDNNVSYDQLENFNFIQTWVNTACPRIGFDDQERFRKGVINLNDAYFAADIVAKNCNFNL